MSDMGTHRRGPYPAEAPADPLETSPFDGDLDAVLAARPEARRTSRLTLALAAGVILVLGMLLGIQAHKAWGSGGERGGTSFGAVAGQRGTNGGTRSGFGGQAGQTGQAGQGGVPGQPGGQGQGGGFTVGTVKLVDGGKLYVQTAGGGLVVVTTTDGTKVQVSKAGKLKDLKPGSTVVVQGTQGEDGSVSATSVNGGGFGARGGG
ncbi:hypothetical protein Skr01_53060 [Sphaerisporangium krabiense]|uniref:Ferric-dicitrate binding protein FerR (Iron transport regulator) n=1 Tax=Sphaerisporangium krabiense TaxID=763782 RepID=A0A7W9DQ14_9ACTN|nr:hypothetical protein [Sphaerisporangium krabiense]MBB5627067.1 ferric-dicitrate binding protein FerR (iron transport regulator) [Sphaerisporangium krabiense]GII65221.1 hypothetical protein Skr01_53060 [Sphaerisporangium krabiense]